MEPQGEAPISKFAPGSPLEEADSNLRSPGWGELICWHLMHAE